MKLVFEEGNNRAKVLDAMVTTNKTYNSVYIEKPVINALKAAQQLDKIEQATMHIIYIVENNKEDSQNRWEITEAIPPSNVGIGSILYSLPGKPTIKDNDIICNL